MTLRWPSLDAGSGLQVRLLNAQALAIAGRADEAHALLEELRVGAVASDDAVDRAMYLRTSAWVLDLRGDATSALEPARAALELARQHWPDGRETFLAMRTLMLVLRRAGRPEEAMTYMRDLIALGDALPGADLAAAVLMSIDELPEAERLPLLERARFRCKVQLAESPPTGVALIDFSQSFAQVIGRLSDLYARAGRGREGERMLLAATQLVAPNLSTPKLRLVLGYLWSRLGARAAERDAFRESRLFARYTLAVLDHPAIPRAETDIARERVRRLGGLERSDDLDPLDAVRLIHIDQQSWVGHPSRGAFLLETAATLPSQEWGQVVDVALNGVHAFQAQ